MEQRFKTIVEQEQRKYWGNVIILFGIFVAIFSFIIVSLPRIEIDIHTAFWKIIALNTAQILPLAIVLALFVLVLSKLFR